MELKWLGADLVEVKNGRFETEVILFTREQTGRAVDRAVHIAAGVWQVALR